jgi:AraC-like DNA-binding protein
MSIGSIDRSVFTVNALPRQDRFEVWRTSLGTVFEIEGPSRIDGGGASKSKSPTFSGSLEALLFGGMLLVRVRSSGFSWRRSARMIARNGLDHIVLKVQETGQTAYETGGASGVLMPGQVVVSDLREEMASESGAFGCLSLVLPRRTLEPFLRVPDDQHGRLLSEREPLVALLRDHLKGLMTHGQGITLEGAKDVVPATSALAAACLNAGLDDRPGLIDGMGRTALSMLKSHIEENLTDRGLTTDRLARDFGLSRSKLYRLFNPLGGVASYVRERRLRHAMSVLMDHDQAAVPIYLIATGAGFGDETDFSRAFRRRFGVTPRDIRREGALRDEDVAETPGVDRRYEGWLRHLGD